jgi:hypothetical protein
MKEFGLLMDEYHNVMDEYQETLASKLGISIQCASHVLYLRTRSRWTQKLEDELIQSHKDGKPLRLNEI